MADCVYENKTLCKLYFIVWLYVDEFVGEIFYTL